MERHIQRMKENIRDTNRTAKQNKSEKWDIQSPIDTLLTMYAAVAWRTSISLNNTRNKQENCR